MGAAGVIARTRRFLSQPAGSGFNVPSEFRVGGSKCFESLTNLLSMTYEVNE